MKIQYILLFTAVLLLSACNGKSRQQQTQHALNSAEITDDAKPLDIDETNNLVIQDKYRFTVGIGSPDGKQVVATTLYGQESDLQEFAIAIYQGRQYPIQFDKIRAEEDIIEKGDGRETTPNFPDIAGALFNITTNPVSVKEDNLVYTLLCNRAFMDDYEVLPRETRESTYIDYGSYMLSPQELATKKDFEKRYQRPVKHLALYDSIPSKGVNFYIMQFEIHDGDALGVIAVQTNQGYAVLEEHATIAEKDESYVWYTADEGVYCPYVVVDCFVRKSDGHMVFLCEGIGAEEAVHYRLYHIQGQKLIPYGQLRHASVDGDFSYNWSFYQG